MYKNAFGMNSIKSNSALNIDDIFAIASMTKDVTAVAVMQLYEQRRIDLNDPIAKYLPQIRCDTKTALYLIRVNW